MRQRFVKPECPAEFPHYLKTNATLTALAMTRDFKSWIRAGWITDPLLDDRDAILFPEKIGGQFWLMHRPLEWVGPRYGTEQACAWIKGAHDLLGLPAAPSRLLIKQRYPWEVFMLMLFLKGVLVSMAGPTPNFAIQHVLSTRSPREAALENLMMAVVSIAPRFLLIAGIAVLGIEFLSTDLQGMGAKVDFEKILPGVVASYPPVGCKGLIIAGLLAAFMSTFVSTVNSGVAYIVFLSVLGFSAIASVVACLATNPEPDDVLMEFYRTVRPWGFWQPILARCRAATPQIEPNRDCARDWFNVVVGIVWQIAMVAAPIYLVIRQWPRFWLWTAVFVFTSLTLKFTWYDKLRKGDGYLARER